MSTFTFTTITTGRIDIDAGTFKAAPDSSGVVLTWDKANRVSLGFLGITLNIDATKDTVVIDGTSHAPNFYTGATLYNALVSLFPKATTTGGTGGSATTDASQLTSGTLPDARISGNITKNLTPTAIKTAAYTAAANEFVKTDASAGNVPVTLPPAPADKTRIAVKMIAVSGSNTTTIAVGGADVFNKAGGSVSISLPLLNQAIILQYESATGIWNVVSGDIPLSGLDGRFALKTSIRRGYSFALGLGSDIQTGTNITNNLIIENNGTIQKAWINAKTPPTGSALIVNIKVNGTSIWATNTGNRLQLASGANIGSQTSFDTTAVNAGDLLSIDVVQVGSTVAGQYATIQLVINQ